MDCNDRSVLAVDIGGSKVVAAVVDTKGNITGQRKFMWDSYEREHVIERLCQTVSDLLKECGPRPAAVGFTCPGFADPATGMWLSAAFMNLYRIPLREIIGSRFGLPVFVEKDTNACCLAEKIFGCCQGEDDFLYMTVSNGVGGAFFLDGKLYYGRHGYAGEYGMCVVKEGGVELERKGIAGCLEMYASGRGLTRAYLESGGQSLLEGRTPDGRTISALARQGDPAALRAFELEGRYLGKVIAAACNLLDPGKVIIGGGLSLTFDLFWPSLDSTMRREHYRLEDYSSLVTVAPTSLGYYGGLYGAAVAALLGLQTDGSRKLGYRG